MCLLHKSARCAKAREHGRYRHDRTRRRGFGTSTYSHLLLSTTSTPLPKEEVYIELTLAAMPKRAPHVLRDAYAFGTVFIMVDRHMLHQFKQLRGTNLSTAVSNENMDLEAEVVACSLNLPRVAQQYLGVLFSSL